MTVISVIYCKKKKKTIYYGNYRFVDSPDFEVPEATKAEIRCSWLIAQHVAHDIVRVIVPVKKTCTTNLQSNRQKNRPKHHNGYFYR